MSSPSLIHARPDDEDRAGVRSISSVTHLRSRSRGARETLPDGSALTLRALEPEDGDLLREVFDGMGPRSRERRFLTPKHTLTATDLRQLTAVDHHDHEAVVAFSVTDGRPVGVARLVRGADHPDTADVAVAVVDAWQDRGVGTALASSLVARARELRIRRFALLMAPDNEAAVRLMHRVLGDVEHASVDRETAEFVVALAPRHRGGRFVLKGA
jgi:RimJ/RimL family protein N-acetyltransferase